jgi:SAM-dependent methyltransferase
MKKLNLGSGPKEIKGWTNYDNSYSLYLSRHSIHIIKLMNIMKIISDKKLKLIEKYKEQKIIWADIVNHIPEENNTVDVIYLSHVIEHIDEHEVGKLFNEIKRVMKHGGVLRISVPNIRILVEDYLKNRDADQFIERTMLSNKRPKSIFDKLQIILVGTRNHQWMYDEQSLVKLLNRFEFKNIKVLEPGITNITESSGLDLYERADESLYIECSI